MPKKDKLKRWTLENLEVRAIPNDNGEPSKPVICGYAAVYNSESELLYGFFREVIRPGAFDSSLNNDVRCLWNHNAAYVLGRTTAGTLNIRSDAKGLFFEVTPPETQWANDLVESIRRKDIDQMSFGFSVNDDNWEILEDGTEMRELLDVNLQEVSVVTFPAYQATSAGLRSLDQEDEEVKKRVEERQEQDKPSEPDKYFFDYLKMLNSFDQRAKNSEGVKEEDDEADGGEPEDPGSEADDSNNDDTTDDDEGDEDKEKE